MQKFTRILQPKRYALSLWVGYLVVMMIAILAWRFSAPSYQLGNPSDAEESPPSSNRRFDVAAAELTSIAQRLGGFSVVRPLKQLFPQKPVQVSQGQSLLVADTLVVQSGNRLVVFLNGRPVTRGMRLPNGDTVTKLTQHAITLIDVNGTQRTLALGNSIQAVPANSKDGSK